VADRPSDPAGGVPNQFWATGRHTIDPAWRRPHRSWPLGRVWADGYAGRDGQWWPRFDPQNVDPGEAGLLRERWECGTCWFGAPP